MRTAEDGPMRIGGPIRLGDEIGFLDGDIRVGRIVGIRKDDCRAMERIIYRRFRPGDDRWPTGGYYTSHGIGMVPFVDGPDAQRAPGFDFR